jgi:hypothetical protein
VTDTEVRCPKCNQASCNSARRDVALASQPQYLLVSIARRGANGVARVPHLRSPNILIGTSRYRLICEVLFRGSHFVTVREHAGRLFLINDAAVTPWTEQLEEEWASDKSCRLVVYQQSGENSLFREWNCSRWLSAYPAVRVNIATSFVVSGSTSLPASSGELDDLLRTARPQNGSVTAGGPVVWTGTSLVSQASGVGGTEQDPAPLLLSALLPAATNPNSDSGSVDMEDGRTPQATPPCVR